MNDTGIHSKHERFSRGIKMRDQHGGARIWKFLEVKNSGKRGDGTDKQSCP